MNLLCRILDHRRALPVIHNHGLLFATCQRCGADLVREPRAPWRAVPRGFRVVWKEQGRHAIAPGGNFATRDGLGPIKSGHLSLPDA